MWRSPGGGPADDQVWPPGCWRHWPVFGPQLSGCCPPWSDHRCARGTASAPSSHRTSASPTHAWVKGSRHRYLRGRGERVSYRLKKQFDTLGESFITPSIKKQRIDNHLTVSGHEPEFVDELYRRDEEGQRFTTSCLGSSQNVPAEKQKGN